MKEIASEPIDIRDFIGSVNDYSKNTPIEGGNRQTEGDVPALPLSLHESPLPNESNVQGEPIRRTTSKQRKARWMNIGSSFSEPRRLPTGNPCLSAVPPVTALTMLSAGSVNAK